MLPAEVATEPSLPTEPCSPATETSPENSALSAELRAVLEAAIRALPERPCTVLVPREVEGPPAEEECALLKIAAEIQTRLLILRLGRRLSQSADGPSVISGDKVATSQ